MGIHEGIPGKPAGQALANRTQRAGQAAIFPSVQICQQVFRMSSGHWAKWQISANPLGTMARKGWKSMAIPHRSLKQDAQKSHEKYWEIYVKTMGRWMTQTLISIDIYIYVWCVCILICINMQQYVFPLAGVQRTCILEDGSRPRRPMSCKRHPLHGNGGSSWNIWNE